MGVESFVIKIYLKEERSENDIRSLIKRYSFRCLQKKDARGRIPLSLYADMYFDSPRCISLSGTFVYFERSCVILYKMIYLLENAGLIDYILIRGHKVDNISRFKKTLEFHYQENLHLFLNRKFKLFWIKQFWKEHLRRCRMGT